MLLLPEMSVPRWSLHLRVQVCASVKLPPCVAYRAEPGCALQGQEEGAGKKRERGEGGQGQARSE
jgi:hypothetical protein